MKEREGIRNKKNWNNEHRRKTERKKKIIRAKAEKEEQKEK